MRVRRWAIGGLSAAGAVLLAGAAAWACVSGPAINLSTVNAKPVVGGAVAQPATGRPTGLVTTDNSISGASLALIGLGVAGVGMFVAGMAALFAGRRGRAPEAARVRS